MDAADPKPSWQILAELNLPIGADFESQLRRWMFEPMRMGGLPAELLNKIFISAMEAMPRAELQTSEMMAHPLAHLRIFTPTDVSISPDANQNWGFFRIGKHGIPSSGSDSADHRLEFFLYLEG